MYFNDETNNTGLIQDCESILGMEDAEISGDTTKLKNFTRFINIWYRRVNSWIWEATDTWEYDDSNWDDFPIATTTIVNSQQDYSIPSTAQRVDRVEILDISGDYQLLEPLDKDDIKDSSLSEHLETPGLPTHYDMTGRSIFLYPKPSTAKVTALLGLKIYFVRDIKEFAYKEGTADATLTDHLVDDTSAQFTADDIGRTAKNTTDTTEATITAVTDSGDVTLSSDIFIDTEEYKICSDSQEPGFVNNFHRLLSLGASYDYCIAYEIGEKANFIKGQINEMKEELKTFHASRVPNIPINVSGASNFNNYE